MNNERKNALIEKYIVTDPAFYRKSLSIIIPVVLQNCINTGVNMMDTIMVGKLGEVAISASSLANQFYLIFMFLCMGLSAAGLVLASMYWGGNNRAVVRKVFDMLYQIVILCGAIFGILSFLFPSQIMKIYTDDAEVIAAGANYLKVTSLIFIPHGIALVTSNVIRSTGNAKLGLNISLISFAVNIFCNYVFIFGKCGMPAMGVTGAALGTLCARIVEFIVCFVYMLKYDKAVCYKLSGLLKLPKKDLFSEFIRLGLPAIISDTILALASSAISMILGHMGKEIVSAYAIVMVVDRLCSVATTGMASASAVVIGHTVGEGDFKRAMREGYSFTILSTLLGVVAAILVLTVGVLSINLYDIAGETYTIAVSMMQASAVIVIFQSLQSVLSKGVLRGGGDTKFLMVADVIFQWFTSIPLGYLAGLVLGWPAGWVMLVLRVDYVIKSVWLLVRLSGGKWIHPVKKITA